MFCNGGLTLPAPNHYCFSKYTKNPYKIYCAGASKEDKYLFQGFWTTYLENKKSSVK